MPALGRTRTAPCRPCLQEQQRSLNMLQSRLHFVTGMTRLQIGQPVNQDPAHFRISRPISDEHQPISALPFLFHELQYLARPIRVAKVFQLVPYNSLLSLSLLLFLCFVCCFASVPVTAQLVIHLELSNLIMP